MEFTSQLLSISLDIVDVFGGMLALGTHGESFKQAERYLIIGIFKILESRVSNIPLFLATKCSIICDVEKDLTVKVLECAAVFNVVEYFNVVLNQVLHDIHAFLEIVYLFGLCILTQLFLFKYTNVNIRRKMFHFFIFFVFYRECKISMLLGEGLLLLLGLVSSSIKVNMLLRPFFSRNDRGRTTLSHVYLLSACTYPSYFISHEEYVCTLISVCFVDSIASMVGEHLKTNSKSLQGTAAGVVSGILIHTWIYGKSDMTLYFLLVGMVEHLTCINDNISIPLFSVLYFRCRRDLGAFELRKYKACTS